MQFPLRTVLVALAVLQVQLAIAFDVVDEFDVMDKVISPDDFSTNGPSIKSVTSNGIGSFNAERVIWIHNNTIGFPEASVDSGGIAESQLTFSMDQIGPEQTAGWMRLGVGYDFPEPLNAFANRTINDSVLISLDVSGNRPPPPMLVSVRHYATGISGTKLHELAILHDGLFTVALNINDFVDRSGLTPEPSVFDLVNSIGVSFLHIFDGDTRGNWQVSIRKFGPGLMEPVPETSTFILGAMATLSLLCVRARVQF